MKLKTLYYIEHTDTPKEWELEKFDLHDIDLFVAKNATGKSRTLAVIHSLSLILTQKVNFSDCKFIAEFTDNEDTIEYKVEFVGKAVIQESLIKNNEHLITREKNGSCTIWFDGLKAHVPVKLPEADLAISRKDSIQHPYLNSLDDWGKNSIIYLFGSDMGKATQTVFKEVSEDIIEEPDLKNGNLVIQRFKAGKSLFGDEFLDTIKNDMKQIGYFIDDIKIEGSNLTPNFSPMAKCIYVKESDINSYVAQHNLSQGMFRALSLIINLNYIQFKELNGCILIDDIGEGLDFERSSTLIKLLIEKSNKSFNQLFMTTNDRYVMNEVSLDYWSIIIRKNQTCSIMNKDNSKVLFDDFQYTGLNNFDFLSMDFYKTDLLH
jgi:hypothetical protein